MKRSDVGRLVALAVIVSAIGALVWWWGRDSGGSAEEPQTAVTTTVGRDVPSSPVVVRERGVGPVLVTLFGAVPDDGVDDTVAIQAALDDLEVGETLVFPSGVFVQGDVLWVRQEGVTIMGEPGATLDAVDFERQAVFLEGDGVTVTGLRFVSGATQRLTGHPHHRIVLESGASGQRVSGVRIEGGSAAGIYVFGARDYEITDNTIVGTLADAIHNTSGARGGYVARNVITDAGDDCVAVVSYVRDDRVSGDIVIEDNRCVDGRARGYTVVGGEDVRIENNHVEGSRAAGIYLASEESFNTYAAKGVFVGGNTVVRANHDLELDHGAILVHGRDGSATSDGGEVTWSLVNEDIDVVANTVLDTIGGQAHIDVNNQYADGVRIVDNVIEGEGLVAVRVVDGAGVEVGGNVFNGGPVRGV